MTTKIRAEGMNLKGVPSVIVVMGKWMQESEPHLLGVFGGEDRLAKATARCEEVLSGENARAEAWIVGDFFVQ